jgi:5'(3')-deoxyribonucleotidase
MSIKVFLDMDGVIADFVSAAVRVHGKPDPYLLPSSLGIFDMEKLWGITIEEFWAPINDAGASFWSTLEPMKDAFDIAQTAIDFAGGPENVCVLTSPSNDPGCIPGKRAWMEMHFPELKKNMLFGSAKHFLAGPNRILVDDRDKNLEDFAAHGGRSVCVPRLWNRLHSLSDFSGLSVWAQFMGAKII